MARRKTRAKIMFFQAQVEGKVSNLLITIILNVQKKIQPVSNNTTPISWRYTYVTTNQPESQELPGQSSSNIMPINKLTINLLVYDSRVVIYYRKPQVQVNQVANLLKVLYHETSKYSINLETIFVMNIFYTFNKSTNVYEFLKLLKRVCHKIIYLYFFHLLVYQI